MWENLGIMFNVLWRWSLWILLYGIITISVLAIISYIGLKFYKKNIKTTNNIKVRKINIEKDVA